MDREDEIDDIQKVWFGYFVCNFHVSLYSPSSPPPNTQKKKKKKRKQ